MIKAEAFEAFKTLDFNVCMQCGTCTGSCPISIKSKLTPRKLMLETAYLFHSLITYPPLNMKQKTRYGIIQHAQIVHPDA